jgi:hypothetical protein
MVVTQTFDSLIDQASNEIHRGSVLLVVLFLVGIEAGQLVSLATMVCFTSLRERLRDRFYHWITVYVLLIEGITESYFASR